MTPLRAVLKSLPLQIQVGQWEIRLLKAFLIFYFMAVPRILPRQSVYERQDILDNLIIDWHWDTQK
jgi:hypothetical protein